MSDEQYLIEAVPITEGFASRSLQPLLKMANGFFKAMSSGNRTASVRLLLLGRLAILAD